MKLRVFKFDKHAKIGQPRQGDAGYDLYALNDVNLLPTDAYGGITPTKIETGIAVSIPEGYAGLIWDKSGIASKGVKVFGGLIDSSYRGQVIVILANETSKPIKFEAGDKITQMIIVPVETPELEFVEYKDDLGTTDRGEGGFGSTGVR